MAISAKLILFFFTLTFEPKAQTLTTSNEVVADNNTAKKIAVAA